jgi:hypothetical protein
LVAWADQHVDGATEEDEIRETEQLWGPNHTRAETEELAQVNELSALRLRDEEIWYEEKCQKDIQEVIDATKLNNLDEPMNGSGSSSWEAMPTQTGNAASASTGVPSSGAAVVAPSVGNEEDITMSPASDTAGVRSSGKIEQTSRAAPTNAGLQTYVEPGEQAERIVGQLDKFADEIKEFEDLADEMGLSENEDEPIGAQHEPWSVYADSDCDPDRPDLIREDSSGPDEVIQAETACTGDAQPIASDDALYVNAALRHLIVPREPKYCPIGRYLQDSSVSRVRCCSKRMKTNYDDTFETRRYKSQVSEGRSWIFDSTVNENWWDIDARRSSQANECQRSTLKPVGIVAAGTQGDAAQTTAAGAPPTSGASASTGNVTGDRPLGHTATPADYYDTFENPNTAHWVTRAGIKYHKYKCSGTNA